MAQPAPTPRETFKHREEERLRAREALRQEMLSRTRAAVARLAPTYPTVAGVYLFGSLLDPGRFTAASDIDIAVDCADLEEESRFWRALEEALAWNVDVRPRRGPIARAVELYGERCDAGKADRP